MKTLKTFLFLLSIFSVGALLVAKVASGSERGGDMVRRMNANNYILAFGILILVAAGFAFLNSAMDAEKAKRAQAEAEALAEAKKSKKKTPATS